MHAVWRRDAVRVRPRVFANGCNAHLNIALLEEVFARSIGPATDVNVASLDNAIREACGFLGAALRHGIGLAAVNAWRTAGEGDC